MRKDDSDRIEKWAAISLRTALALLLTLILCGPAAVAQSTTFNGNGAFANAFGCSGPQTSFECFSVLVFVGSTNGQTTTSLIYDHSIFDLSTGAFQDTFGEGSIPNSAFHVDAHTDSLNVDTSKISPDVFFQEFCTFDPNTGNGTCNPISGGVVTGTWNVIRNLDTQQFSGTFKATFANMTIIQTGTSTSQVAFASVNVLGAALANITANVGTNHNTAISVQVLH